MKHCFMPLRHKVEDGFKRQMLSLKEELRPHLHRGWVQFPPVPIITVRPWVGLMMFLNFVLEVVQKWP